MSSPGNQGSSDSSDFSDDDDDDDDDGGWLAQSTFELRNPPVPVRGHHPRRSISSNGFDVSNEFMLLAFVNFTMVRTLSSLDLAQAVAYRTTRLVMMM
jgi:hypothetical protein